jgi:hypothetical protein
MKLQGEESKQTVHSGRLPCCAKIQKNDIKILSVYLAVDANAVLTVTL